VVSLSSRAAYEARFFYQFAQPNSVAYSCSGRLAFWEASPAFSVRCSVRSLAARRTRMLRLRATNIIKVRLEIIRRIQARAGFALTKVAVSHLRVPIKFGKR